MLSVRVPATSANLGPGFDCLGLAVTLYNTIHLEESDSFQIHLSGTYNSGLPLDKSNLVWKSMCLLWEKAGRPIPTVSITLENNIPPARGLGSSSAAIIGGLMAANTFTGEVLTKQEILELANEIEGHPDNITPALYGGITLALEDESTVLARTLCKKPQLSVLAIVPDFELQTDKSRKVLPEVIRRKDAVFNISHVALLVEALIHEDYEFLSLGMQDRLHQMQRANLVPGLPETLQAALTAGAFGAALSGSGPTVLALIPPHKNHDVSEAMLQAFTTHGLQAKAYELAIDSEGAVLL